jgi:hypothetical protein
VSDSHTEGIVVGVFCAQRAEKCDLHENQYQKNCEPPASNWSGYFFVQGDAKRCLKKPEAHHVLCVACVTEFMGKDQQIGKAEKLAPIVKQTNWCINAKPNMLAMPLWGHTLKWYVLGFSQDPTAKLDQLLQAAPLMSGGAPPFKDIPQHDYDHNSERGYKKEVDKNLQRLAEQIAKVAKKSHKLAVEELKEELEQLSAKFKRELSRRGKRQGGTDRAWKSGLNNTNPQWYEPFSMANDGNVAEREFPAVGRKSKLRAKMQSMLTALGKWG